MDEIIKKIYSEKDINTNISIFIGASVGLCFYIWTHDIYLTAIISIGIFAIIKVISSVITQKIYSFLAKKNLMSSFSSKETRVIETFINHGTSFLILSDLNKGKIEVDDIGFHSLVSRGIIEFIDRGFGDGPAGFQLSEIIYKHFLNR